MKKRPPYWLILICLFIAISGWILLKRGTPVHPLKAFPPYLSEVTVFPLNQYADSLDLPPANQPQAKDFELLKQARDYWVDKELLFDTTIIYAFDRNNPGSLSTLLALKVFSASRNLDTWTAFVPADRRQEHTYRRSLIVHDEREGQPTFYFALKKGVLLISSDQRMVERSIALMDEKAPNLYAHLRRHQLWKKKSSPQLFFNTGITTDPHWNQLEWEASAKTLSLEGTDHYEDQLFQDQLARQQVVDFSAFLPILPDRIQLADMISIENAALFFKQKETLGPRFWTPSLTALLQDQIAYVIEGDPLNPSSFLVVPLNDPEQGEDILNKTADQNGLLENVPYQAQVIRRMLAEDISTPFFGERYPDIKNPYWTVMDGFLICSNDPDRLKLWIDYLVLQKNLVQSEPMDGFYSLFQTNSQRMILWQSALSQGDTDTDDQWWKSWTKTFPAGILSWRKDGKGWTVKGKLNKQSSQQPLPEIQWRKDFHQPLEYGPSVLTNPLTAEIYALVVQDESHRLYLHDPDGELLWEKDLDSPILGKMQTFQLNPVEWGLLFNTEKAIYKLDAHGGEMASWPLNIEAVDGLQTCTFGEPGDPHYFLPSENKSIYGYTILGDALINWNPCPTDAEMGSSIFHMASATKDHLFWLDDKGGFHSKYRDGTDVMVSGLPSRIESMFFSKKYSLTYVLAVNGELGYLTPGMNYRVLVKNKEGVSAYHWSETEEGFFLLIKDKDRIQRFRIEGEKARREMALPYPSGRHRLDLVSNGQSVFTLVADLDKQRLSILDDQGKGLFAEFIPSIKDLAVYPLKDDFFMATGIGGELVVYRLMID